MTIGNQLKKARQKKQVTVYEVFQQTRIHPNVLSALEEDRFGQVLNPAYIRSFLKEYAAYLGLDTKKILAEYDDLYPGENLGMTEPRSTKRKLPLPKIDLTKIAKFLGIAAASILVIFLIRAAVRAVISIPRKRATRPRETELAKPPKPVAAAVKEKGVKEKAQKVPQKVIPRRAARPSGRVSIPAGEKLRLTIAVTDDVWMQLKVDGKIIFKNVLKKGSAEQWEANNNFTIWTGKAEAMRLDLNGNDLGAPGAGVKKDIIVTRKGIKKKG